MAYADLNTYFGHDGTIVGCFTEAEVGKVFEYSKNIQPEEDVQRFLVNGADWTSLYPFKVWVMDESNPMREHDHGFRYARVLKTRLYVVVDEDENGPVEEKWYMKPNTHRYYAKSIV